MLSCQFKFKKKMHFLFFIIIYLLFRGGFLPEDNI